MNFSSSKSKLLKQIQNFQKGKVLAKPELKPMMKMKMMITLAMLMMKMKKTMKTKIIIKKLDKEKKVKRKRAEQRPRQLKNNL